MRAGTLLAVSLIVFCLGRGQTVNLVTAENYQKVDGGMSPDQVKAIFGEPHRVQQARSLRGASQTAWEYRSGDKLIIVWFYSDRVVQKDEVGLGVGMKTYR